MFEVDQIVLRWQEAVDPDVGLDLMTYVHQVLDPAKVLPQLGFTYGGAGEGTDYWTKKLTPRIFLAVNFNSKDEVFNFRKIRLANPRKFSGEFKVLDAAFGISLSELKAKLAEPGVLTEGQELVWRLLDNDPDALEPRGELDRLLPGKCPECGSSNVSDADDEGLIDCMNCGIWFEPLHPANSPTVPGNYPEPKEYARLHLRYHGDADVQQEAFDPDDPAEFISRLPVLNPRICVTFSQTTPESSEQGDVSDSGWIDEEGVEMTPDAYDREEGLTAVDLAVKYLWDEGASEPSSSHFHFGVWYSTGYHTINYRTGTDEERCFHLKDFSEAEEQAVWDKLHAKWNRARLPH